MGTLEPLSGALSSSWVDSQGSSSAQDCSERSVGRLGAISGAWDFLESLLENHPGECGFWGMADLGPSSPCHSTREGRITPRTD